MNFVGKSAKNFYFHEGLSSLKQKLKQIHFKHFVNEHKR